MTSNLPVSIHHRHAAGFSGGSAFAPLAHIKQGTAIAAETVGSGYNSTGTKYTQTLGGLYGPEREDPVTAVVRAYMGAWEWRKCGESTSQSCSADSVSSTVTTGDYPLRTLTSASELDELQIVAYLRTTTVYVDRPNFHVVFSALDKFGSPRFKISGGAAITVAATADAPDFNAISCAITDLGNGAQSLYSCSGTVKATAFSKDLEQEYAFTMTAEIGGAVKHQLQLGRLSAEYDQNKLTRAKHPDWWHADLRANLWSCAATVAYHDGCNTWPLTVQQPSMSTVITTPTHPLYPGETFDVHLYHIKTYINNGKIGAFDFNVKWDPAFVSYVSVEANGDFTGITEKDNGDNVQVTVLGAATNVYFSGFFLMYKIKFQVKSTLAAGEINSGIAVQMGKILAEGSANLGPGHFSSVFDHRQADTYGGNCGGVECTIDNMGTYAGMKASGRRRASTSRQR